MIILFYKLQKCISMYSLLILLKGLFFDLSVKIPFLKAVSSFCCLSFLVNKSVCYNYLCWNDLQAISALHIATKPNEKHTIKNLKRSRHNCQQTVFTIVYFVQLWYLKNDRMEYRVTDTV